MDAARREEVYLRLRDLQVIDMDHAVERGPSYLLERLKQCRRQQDEVLTLSVEIKRATSKAKIASRMAKSAMAWTDQRDASRKQALKDEYETALSDFDELRTLEEVAAISRMNLRTADSDIRLGAQLLEQQIKLGVITTPPAGETSMSTPLSTGEIAASAYLPDTDQPEPAVTVTASTVASPPPVAPAVDLSALFAMNNAPPAPIEDAGAAPPASHWEIPPTPSGPPPQAETVTMPPGAMPGVVSRPLSEILSNLS
jgi:hypothetical protein